MALYVFDGTGNEDKDGDTNDTNPCKFFHAYQDPNKNSDPDKPLGSIYLKGIGRRAKTLVGMGFAEAFGIGGFDRVQQALTRLKHNIDAGDKVVDVSGFSRGAALALSFANRVAHELPAVRIRFIGLFDVVGEFGLPGRFINAGHDLHMPSNADHVFHAMALDESRAFFPLTRLGGHTKNDRLCEVWFRGVHSDVGGGNNNPGLNWIALGWLFANAKRLTLPIDDAVVTSNAKSKGLAMAISDHKVDAGVNREIRPTDLLYATVVLDRGAIGRPNNNPAFPMARIDDLGTITEPATA